MLRPASLLPSLSRAFDTPLRAVGSLLPPGVCYRALWRLPGRDFHPPENRVFQDASYAHYTTIPSLLDLGVKSLESFIPILDKIVADNAEKRADQIQKPKSDVWRETMQLIVSLQEAGEERQRQNLAMFPSVMTPQSS